MNRVSKDKLNNLSPGSEADLYFIVFLCAAVEYKSVLCQPSRALSFLTLGQFLPPRNGEFCFTHLLGPVDCVIYGSVHTRCR